MKFFKKIPQIIMSILAILTSASIYAVAIKYFIMPSKVILTGFEGVSLSIAYFKDDTSLFILLYIAFQTVLFTTAFVFLSKRFASYTALLVMTVATLLTYLPNMTFASPESDKERIILVIFGGLLVGTAKALAFRFRGSTGDEDVIATYISQKYLKPVGSIAIIAGIFSTTVGLGLTFIKTGNIESVINTLMYTSIYIFVSAVTLDELFKKYQLTKLIIITKHQNDIASVITGFCDKKTYTVHDGLGGFEKTKQHVISVILPHEEILELIDLLKDADKTAFIYYHNIEGVASKIHMRSIV